MRRMILVLMLVIVFDVGYSQEERINNFSKSVFREETEVLKSKANGNGGIGQGDGQGGGSDGHGQGGGVDVPINSGIEILLIGSIIYWVIQIRREIKVI